MLTIILLVILALGFSYFSAFNSQLATITIPGYAQMEIPLYILMGITLVLGLSFFWIISLIDSLTYSMKLRGKEHTIKDAKATIHDLTHRINQLEIENAKLTERTGIVKDSNSL
jgi:cell shape-determining protein MreC